VGREGDEFSQIFDEDFVRGGIPESSLRRPPVTTRRNPASAVGNPMGPRDWSPAEAARPRRRGLLVLGAIVVACAAALVLWHPGAHGPSHPPITIPPEASASRSPQVYGLSDLGIGACFDERAAGGRILIAPRSCAGSHTDQLIAREQASGDNRHFPADSYWNGPVAQRCYHDLIAWTGRPRAQWPPYLTSADYIPVPDGWATGGGRSSCSRGPARSRCSRGRPTDGPTARVPASPAARTRARRRSDGTPGLW
jgi:hypothetical protein